MTSLAFRVSSTQNCVYPCVAGYVYTPMLSRELVCLCIALPECIHTHMHMHSLARAHTPRGMSSPSPPPPPTHTYTQTYTHMRTHAHSQAHTHTHTQQSLHTTIVETMCTRYFSSEQKLLTDVYRALLAAARNRKQYVPGRFHAAWSQGWVHCSALTV